MRTTKVSSTAATKVDTAKIGSATSGAVAAIEVERTNFKALLALNPNYFGNALGSKLPVVKAIGGNTTYEELTCVGFQPQINQLEATISVKKTSGYSGNLCSGGSEEYVRFYISTDGGATWTDEGLSQFTAYDVSHTGVFEMAVTNIAAPARKLCGKENIIKARAILSWNVPPPPNSPNYVPVWGNSLTVDIITEPRRFLIPVDIGDLVSIKDKINLEAIPEFQIPIPDPEPDPFPSLDLQKAYISANVPNERTFFTAAHQIAESSGRAMQFLSLKSGAAESPFQLADSKIDLSKIFQNLLNFGDGNQTFEQLTCIGYDPENDALTGVIHVKKSSGYSGGQCGAGSREYVAWWVDWGDGAGWTYAGTSSVKVYDIQSIPATGLRYAVFEPINSIKHRLNCNRGAVMPKVRAILSWQVAPPTDNPNFVPVWGSREEATILLKPGSLSSLNPILESISSVAVCAIDQATGKTYAPANQPFGRVITITGFIPDAPDISVPPSQKMKYQVRVRKLPGGSPQVLANDFGITVTERIGSALPTQYSITQSVDTDGWYTYQEDMNTSGAGWRLVQGRVMAQWITAAPMHGPYEIEVEAYDPITDIHFTAQSVLCPDLTVRNKVKVYLDEDPPTAAIAITGFTRGGGPLQPAAPCGTFQVGDVLHGTYSALDEHFGSLSMYVLPVAAAHGAAPSPNSRSYPIVPTAGENGTWTLNTAGMDPCGYVMVLEVHDRTIEGTGGWDASDSVGFCLKATG